MLDKILIIDFEDSFTYNIASVLFEHEPSCKVVSHQDFFENIVSDWQVQLGNKAVILGPGPGHPDLYRKYLPAIRELMSDENVFVMGICLGHQIIGLLKGFQVKPVADQVHGQVVNLELNGEKIAVQRYNSLGVFKNNVEEISLQWDRGITYQFHPESIGTENQLAFFEPLLDFINS